MRGKEKNMTEIRNIIQRLRSGQSKRSIHKDLHVHRSIIRELESLATIHQWLNPELPMPNDEEIAAVWNTKKTVQIHILDPFKEQIKQWHQQGYTSVVIHRLLQDKCSCDVQVVRRYRSKHFPEPVKPVMVRSTVAGRDLDLDFGELGRFLDNNGKTRKAWLFSLRLRHSRKAYREIVLDQKLQTFLLGHIHAFEYFNGVPTNCILDNLKAGVIKSTIDNDLINRSYQELAEHYGFVISPCLPRTPQHKGGVEGDVKYVKRNFLPYFTEKQKEMGVTIPTICSLIEALERWTNEVDIVHIVQGVGKSPQEIFNIEEASALNPLPKKRWELTSWYQYIVRRDWRIMHDGAYYSVPFQLIGKTVEICVSGSFLRIFHENKEVALHERATQKWDYKRKTEHAPVDQEAVLQCSREGLLSIAEKIGPLTYQLVEAILSHKSIDKLRPVRHLLRLASKYSQERLEKACQRAFDSKLYSYSSVKSILEKNLDKETQDSSKAEKVIHLDNYRFRRNLDDYKSEKFPKKETFDETVERMHPTSKHGLGMMKPSARFLADQLMEEYLADKEQNNENNLTGVS